MTSISKAIRRSRSLAVLTVAVLSFAACDGGGESVAVELTEFSVTADPNSAGAGEVKFELENVGADTHEFIIIQTDLAPDALLTAEDGSVYADEAGMTLVDEVEDLPKETTEELSVELDSGSYVLICNIVEKEDGETESHYQEGMHTAFTVD